MTLSDSSLLSLRLKIDAINAWRIEDGKGDVIDAWHRAGQPKRFPVWAWENRHGKPWQAQIESVAWGQMEATT